MKRWEGTENEDIIINEQIQKGIEAIKEQRKRKEKTMTYFIDFIENLLQKKNIGVIIYLVLNTLLVISIFNVGATTSQEALTSTFLAIVIYIISLAIALSPIGEWILRLQTGSKKNKRQEQVERLEPLFNEVYKKAKDLHPTLNDNIELFINDDSSPNAFATGRKTITINRGLLKYSDEQIKAVLAHEFAHIAHKDTDITLIILIGNFLVTFLFLFIRIIAFITGLVFANYQKSIGELIKTIVIDLMLVFLMRVWTKIGVLLVSHSSRQKEFEADKFAYNCGYGNELAEVLDTFHGVKASGPWAALISSHPDIDSRIAQLQKLGATYRNAY